MAAKAMLKKASRLVLSLILTVSLSGCWNRNELNALAIVLALGVDMVGDQYEVTVQYIDPSAASRSKTTDRAPTIVLSENEKTIFEALRKLTSKTSRRLYVSHMRFIVIGEQIAKRGIYEPLDLLFRDHEVRPDFYVAVAKNCRVKDVIGFVSPTELIPGIDMYRSLKTSEKIWSPTSAANVKDIMMKLSKDGVDPAITGISLIGDLERGKLEDNVKRPIPYAEFKYEGIGAFHEDRLLGWMNEDESKAYTYLTNHIQSTVGRVRCPDGKGWFVTEVTNSKTKVTPVIREGEPHLKLKVEVEGNIGEMECAIDLMDPHEIGLLEKLAEERQIDILNSGLKKAQQYGSDIFGFGEAFHRKYPKRWRSWRENWNEKFRSDLTYELEVKYKLRRHGKINNPFGKDTTRKE
ncbi:Ger(x)C family spore germination protein [Paenibacillus sp. M1]|uniref:Ger(X)C family spore germination protein n=1 Tax=Paenibacillus haidiansis TaxID=1574488 RepID=A0ABU7VRY5_9BACL